MNRPRMKQSDPAFLNLSLDEMSAYVADRDRQLARRNGFIILTLLVLLLIGSLVSAYFYGNWMLETIGAAGQVVHALWRWDWWQALTIAFQYKLSFFVLGIFVGFGVFLFITFQVGEWLIETAWDYLSALWN
jgi:hypothetical protein